MVIQGQGPILLLLIICFNIYIQFQIPNDTPENRIVKSQYELLYDSFFMFVKINNTPVLFLLQSIDLTSSYNTVHMTALNDQKKELTKLIGTITFVDNFNATIQGENRVLPYYVGTKSNYTNLIPEMSLILITAITNQYQALSSRLAMAYHISDTSHSITHQLKANGLIDNLSFSFQRDDQSNGNCTIFFGGIPNNVINGKYQGSCLVSGQRGFWECTLNYVVIGNISSNDSNTKASDKLYYANKNLNHFSTQHNYIEVPNEFFELLIDKSFSVALKSNICSKTLEYGKDRMQCYCDLIDSFASVSFVFEGVTLKFNSRDLFSEDDSICTYLIISNKVDNNWIIGNVFTTYITSFDYDLHSVVFYSDTPFDSVTSGNTGEEASVKSLNTVTVCIYMSISILMGGMIVILLLFKAINKTNHI